MIFLLTNSKTVVVAITFAWVFHLSPSCIVLHSIWLRNLGDVTVSLVSIWCFMRVKVKQSNFNGLNCTSDCLAHLFTLIRVAWSCWWPAELYITSHLPSHWSSPHIPGELQRWPMHSLIRPHQQLLTESNLSGILKFRNKVDNLPQDASACGQEFDGWLCQRLC